MFFIPVIAVGCFYIGYRTYSTTLIYSFVKSIYQWRSKVYKVDSELGYVHIPNSRGAYSLTIGPSIPMHHDKDGFRIPVEDNCPFEALHPVILSLGCSFTYGDGICAEDTYSQLVAKYLGGKVKNAGVNGYGLSQMLILSRKLIPIHKPDYLIVQYSPWLANRSRHFFEPSFFGKIPTPYFSKEKNQIVLQPPIFQSIVQDLPIDSYRNNPPTLIDFISFLLNVGLPLFIHDDVNIVHYRVKRFLGLIAEPVKDSDEIIKYGYDEISNIAKKNGAKLIIVVLANNDNEIQVPKHLLTSDAVIVNAHNALLKHLSVLDKENYYRSYLLWRGDPPVIVNLHPNEKANRIIAEEIIQAIKNIKIQTKH